MFHQQPCNPSPAADQPGSQAVGQTPCNPYVHVKQACSPRAFAKSLDDHSSSNIVAFSLHAGDDMILAA
eukprot:1161499-Pelagomonas_calceolata.AAC.11